MPSDAEALAVFSGGLGVATNLPAMVTPGVYPKPVPFGGCASRSFRTDFPTTFPITMTVTEAD